MSIYEYDAEKHLKMEREDAFADGRKSGLEAGRTEGFQSAQVELFALINHMTADGMVEAIPRLTSDPDFYNEMVLKYILS